MQNLGWRKPTPGLVAAEMHAQVGEGLSVPKSMAIISVKKVAAHIGLKPAQLMLLDILFAFSKAQDWEKGHRPIVWPSNQYLMDQSGFSLPTLKRHLRRLGELGLISFCDSPNGKRYGKRDEAGNIVEAYGFDLSPLAARAGKFEVLYKEIQTERTALQQLRKQITCTRRSIRAKLMEALAKQLKGPWAKLEHDFRALLAKIPSPNKGFGAFDAVIVELRSLQQQIEKLFADALNINKPKQTKAQQNNQDLTPSPLKTEPHIQYTNHSQLNCNDTSPTRHTQSTSKERIFDFQTFCLACPNFIQMTTELCGQPRRWEDLTRASQSMGLMLGISPPFWQNIISQIGHFPAAVALGLTYEKHMAGLVHNPSGYLSGMAKKAHLGELHLGKSVFGCLARGQGMAA